ncbi:MAG: hypothetical protein JSV06_03065 [Myxococcales bacterium]|nr:MAG: hypothetical protein JSV06_03065 [Myxococcales bacterium]
MRFLHVYWPVLLFLGTALTSWLYDPAQLDSTFPFSLDVSRVVASLTSPVFLTFFGLSVGAIVIARRTWEAKAGFSATDKMATLWFLLNATWFHTGCDIMSGLFQVMPNLTESYIALNDVHTLPMHHPGRVYFDTIYWFELFIEAPLALLVGVLYLRQAKIRPIVETFLNGLYVAGTVAYYMPNIIVGHSPHILMSNLDRAIASVWIWVSVGLTIRSIRQLR